MRCGAKILILGYGNPLRGDDAIGAAAARRLAETIHDPGVDIRELHQLTPELAEPVSEAAHVIFIDAARAEPAGEVRRETVDAAQNGLFTHHITPAALLACARELYGRAPAATLFTAAGAAFDAPLTLSPAAQDALGELCRQVLWLVQGYETGGAIDRS
jgi:hydrogenase maturation protease